MSSRLRIAALLLTLAALPPEAVARPTYFDSFTAFYSLQEGDRLHECGVCHLRWEGTGARNPYGTAVEQELYLGRPIVTAIRNVESDDSDTDGFSNVDEITIHQTLPGYSCSNFFEAIGAPLDYPSYVTPLIASCLEPLDIRVSPSQAGFLAQTGSREELPLEVFNNGSDLPLSITRYEMLPGSDVALAVSGPAAPFDIPVGQSATLTLSFAPGVPVLASGTLRITSNDPDEPVLDVPVQGVGFVKILASPQTRASCLREVDKRFRRYVRRHLREWGRCYLDEVSGRACDVGRRTLRLQAAEAKLRAAIGGGRDRHCLAANLTPSLLDFPERCGAPCDGILLHSIGALTDCLVCGQEAAMRATLDAALGTSPPDLPLHRITVPDASRCQKKVLGRLLAAIRSVQAELARCELERITSGVETPCVQTLAPQIAAIQTKVNRVLDRCTDTTDLLSCPLQPDADPACLGEAAVTIGSGLVRTSFGLQP